MKHSRKGSTITHSSSVIKPRITANLHRERSGLESHCPRSSARRDEGECGQDASQAEENHSPIIPNMLRYRIVIGGSRHGPHGQGHRSCGGVGRDPLTPRAR
jgi:hypothetical protein